MCAPYLLPQDAYNASNSDSKQACETAKTCVKKHLFFLTPQALALWFWKQKTNSYKGYIEKA